MRRPPAAGSQDLVESIIQAAAHVLAERGSDGLSTNRIAELAGVSIGSLYHYFPNKESIVAELVDRYLPKVGEVVGKAIDECTSLDDMVVRIMSGMLQISDIDRVVLKQLVILRTAANAHARVDAYNKELVARMANMFERLGVARGADRHVLAFVILSAGEGVANATIRTPDADLPAIANTYLAIVRSYLQ